MLKAAIFDMDGVLADSEPIYDAVHREILQSYGKTLTDEDDRYFRGQPSRKVWQYVIDTFALDATLEELFDREVRTMREKFARGDIAPIPHVFDLLRALKACGYKIGVATSNFSFNVESMLRHNRAQDDVDCISSFESVSAPKPAPDVFLHAARELGVDGASCVVFEDSPNGIIAAKKAGMMVVGFANPSGIPLDLSQADLIIASFAEVDVAQIKKLFQSDFLHRVLSD